jgi:hypothetical protein
MDATISVRTKGTMMTAVIHTMNTQIERNCLANTSFSPLPPIAFALMEATPHRVRQDSLLRLSLQALHSEPLPLG